MHSSCPEHEILFAAGRRQVDAADFRRLVKEVGDWDYVMSTAGTHGLIPLLHQQLHSVAADLTPVNVLSHLKQHSVANTQNVLHLMGKQLKIHRALRGSGIRLAVFKGSVLSRMAYGDVSLRQAGDIDVLISRVDFYRAKELLESLGYEMTPSLTSTQLDSHLRSHCEINFV